MTHSFKDLRTEYSSAPLQLNQLCKNPYNEFKKWIDLAIAHQILEPNAMILSTCLENKPSARTVLLKYFDEEGFVFFTHYESRKARQIDHCPSVALTFWWKEIERQVCIEGQIEKISYEESDHYFISRPLDSQIATWISPQSQPIASKKELEEKFHQFKNRHQNKNLHCPVFWGGYRVKAIRFEFWQGGKARLSDRFLYEFQNNLWSLKCLAP